MRYANKISDNAKAWFDGQIVNVRKYFSEKHTPINNYSANLAAFLKRDSIYWLCVICTALLSYGFTLTNATIGVDDEILRHYIDGHGLLMQGRWGQTVLTRIVDTQFFLPFWRKFLGLITHVFALTFLTGLFNKYSRGRFDDTTATIFTCVALSFPLLAEVFVFKMTVIEVGLSLFLVALSVYLASRWVMDNKHFGYAFLSIVLLGFTLGMSDNTVLRYFSIAMSLLLLDALFSDNNKRKLLQMFIDIIKFLLIFMCALLLSNFFASMLQAYFDVTYVSQRSTHISYNFGSIADFAYSFVNFARQFVRVRVLFPGTHDLVSFLKWFSTVSIIVICTCCAFILRRLNIFFAGVATAASAYIMLIILGDATPMLRIMSTFSTTIAFSIGLIYIVFNNIVIAKYVKAKQLIIVAVVLLVLTQSRDMNHTFFLDYQRYQRDVMVMHSIINDLGGRQRTKPIVFVGLLTHGFPDRNPNIHVIGITLFNWDRWSNELCSFRLNRFFAMHGFPFQSAYGLDSDVIALQVADMPSWPAYGYIREFEYYIIVMLGNSPRFGASP